MLNIPTAGVVTLKASADFETQASYNFTVIASDGANTSTQPVTVSVTNLNDTAPVFTSGATGTVAENATTATAVYTAATTDADNLAARSYTRLVSAADAPDVPAPGVVTPKASADIETPASYSFYVIARDGSKTTTQPVTVSVTNLNDNPSVVHSGPPRAGAQTTAHPTAPAPSDLPCPDSAPPTTGCSSAPPSPAAETHPSPPSSRCCPHPDASHQNSSAGSAGPLTDPAKYCSAPDPPTRPHSA